MNAFYGSAVAADAANVANLNKQMYVVFHPETMHVLKKADRCSSLISSDHKTLKRQLTMRQNKGQAVGYVLDTIENFYAKDEEIEVRNLMSGETVKIRKSQRGSVCDPSMESYWSM